MLLGQSILNGQPRMGTGAAFQGFDPAIGAHLDPVYQSASAEDVDLAAGLADDAFAIYGKLAGSDKARFLRHIAAGIESIAAELVERAHLETALPKPRLQGEVGRTVNQLGSLRRWLKRAPGPWRASIPAQPDRKPLARADIRSCFGPSARLRSSAPAIFHWPFPLPAETQPRLSRPATP